MQLTLKKFSKDPKHIIRKAPITIIINREPAYAIIPYSVYKANYHAEHAHEVEKNQNGTAFYAGPKKPHSRLWRLLFT